MSYSPKPSDVRPLRYSGVYDVKSGMITFFPDDNGKLTYEDVKRMGGFTNNKHT